MDRTECIYATVGHTPTYDDVYAALDEVTRSRPDLYGKWWYAVELAPGDPLPPGETGDLVLFFRYLESHNTDDGGCPGITFYGHPGPRHTN